MIFAFGSRQHLLDVIEASHQTGAEIEAARPEGLLRRGWFLEGVQTCPQSVVHDCFEWLSLLLDELFEPGCDVWLKRQCGSHVMMLIS